MRLLSELLLFPVTGPIRTVEFVTKRIKDQVEAEYLDEGKVRAQLLELTLKRTHGEIDDAQYREQEAIILARLNEIRAYKRSLEEPPQQEGGSPAQEGNRG